MKKHFRVSRWLDSGPLLLAGSEPLRSYAIYNRGNVIQCTVRAATFAGSTAEVRNARAIAVATGICTAMNVAEAAEEAPEKKAEKYLGLTDAEWAEREMDAADAEREAMKTRTYKS